MQGNRTNDALLLKSPYLNLFKIKKKIKYN